MAEPKKKSSKSRTRQRRHQIKLSSSNYIYCEKCHEPKTRHQICYNCGTYRGKKVMETEKKPEVHEEVKEEGK